MTAHRFPYVQVDPSLGAASALPYMPMTLLRGQQEIAASALVDSGAASMYSRTTWVCSWEPYGNSRPSPWHFPATWLHRNRAAYS